MRLEIISKKTNPLLLRQEIEFSIREVSKTPSRKEVIERLAALTDKDASMIVVDKIVQGFGSKDAVGYAKAYNSKDALEKIEPSYKQKRGEKKEKKEPSPKEEKKEKHPEEKKESGKETAEKKKEEKKEAK